MKRILIADSSKASLVMTSEVFKDHYPGIQVLVAKNSAEAIALAKCTEDIDAFIVDFDLPDTNGAKTALLLKKIAKTPILITAFDNVEVTETIDSLLMKYDDCRSYLKKPVSPEVVIAVAQRYCDGKIRAQRRIATHLPVVVLIELKAVVQKPKIAKVSKAAEEKKSSKKVKEAADKETKTDNKKAKSALKEETENIELYFHGELEDCSLSGVKLKPLKHTVNGLTEWAQLLKNMDNISAGSRIVLQIPSFMDIEFGKVTDFLKITEIKTPKTSVKSKLKSVSKAKDIKKTEEILSQELEGKIIWTSSETGEWKIGVEFIDQNLSKKLFESIVAMQSRQHKSTQSQSIMKTSRVL